MIKNLSLFFLFLQNFVSLTFNLDENNTQQCIFLRGANIGKDLKLEYQIIGESNDNVSFTVRDTIDKELVLEKKT